MKVGDIFVALGIKADSAQINKISSGFKDLRRNLAETALAFSASLYALDRFVESAVGGVAALQNINNQTGLSIELLQKWQNVGTLSNLSLSADQVSNSIGALQKNLAAIQLGQGNIAPFQLLGIDATGQDAFGVLEQLRENIKGMQPATATNLISQLGLDPAMISVLKLSNDEFERLSKQYFLSKGSRESILGVGMAIKNLKMAFTNLKDQAVAKLAPVLTKMINEVFKWLAKNGNKVADTIKSIVNVFKDFVGMIGRSVNLLSTFAEKIPGVDNGLKVVAAAIGIFMLTARPFLLSLTLIALALEDFWYYLYGPKGSSMIGDVVDGLDKLFSKIGVQLKKLDKNLGSPFEKIFGISDAVKGNITMMSEFLDKMQNVANSSLIGALLGFVSPVPGGALIGATAGANYTGYKEFIKPLLDSIKKNDGNLILTGLDILKIFNQDKSEAILPNKTEEKSRLLDSSSNQRPITINNHSHTEINANDPDVWARQSKANDKANSDLFAAIIAGTHRVATSS